MCSNTEITGGGGGGGVDGEFCGGGGGGGGGWSPTSITRESHNNNYNNNNKRQRVPKRGPGVAELEKILREQEKSTNIINNENHHHHQLLIHPRFLAKDQSQPSIPINQTHHHHLDQVALLPSPNTSKCFDNNALLERCIISDHHNGSGRGGGGGATVVLPESRYFQVPWTAPNDQYSHSAYLSSHHHHYLRQKKQSSSLMNNQLSGSASSSSYGGLGHQIEPPSNQKLYQNYRPQEKVIGMKRRPPPLHMEENGVAVAAGSVQSHRHIPEQATLFNRGMGYNLNFTMPMPRDITKWDVPIEFNHLNNRITETSSATTAAATVLPSFHNAQQQLSRIDEYMLPFQGGINQMTLSAESDENKRFYSFLPTIDQMGRKEKMNIFNNTEKNNDKAVEDEIDLNLKLSTYS